MQDKCPLLGIKNFKQKANNSKRTSGNNSAVAPGENQVKEI